MLVQMFSWQKWSLGIPRAGLSKLLLQKIKPRVRSVQWKHFRFLTQPRLTYNSVSVSHNFLFLCFSFRKKHFAMVGVRIQKWKPIYFTSVRAGKDVSSHLNPALNLFFCLVNMAQAGKGFQSFSSAKKFITWADLPSCLGILTVASALMANSSRVSMPWLSGNSFLTSPQLQVKPTHFIFLGTGLERKRKIWTSPGTSWFHSVPARTWVPQSVTQQATLIVTTRWQVRTPRSEELFL